MTSNRPFLPPLHPVPLDVLGKIVGRPPGWMQRYTECYRHNSKGDITMLSALRLVLKMKPRRGAKHQRRVKFRLPVPVLAMLAERFPPTGKVNRSMCLRACTRWYIHEALNSDLLEKVRPPKVQPGKQILDKRFNREDYNCLRVIAKATKTTPSAVLCHALYLALQGEKHGNGTDGTPAIPLHHGLST